MQRQLTTFAQWATRTTVSTVIFYNCGHCLCHTQAALGWARLSLCLSFARSNRMSCTAVVTRYACLHGKLVTHSGSSCMHCKKHMHPLRALTTSPLSTCRGRWQEARSGVDPPLTRCNTQQQCTPRTASHSPTHSLVAFRVEHSQAVPPPDWPRAPPCTSHSTWGTVSSVSRCWHLLVTQHQLSLQR
jgi:hypothetical protein